MEKREWNVPCLLLRWSRCLLCWCSFLRWQEDLGGEENLGESIDFGNFWFLIPEQQLLMLLSFTVYLQTIEGISFAEGVCLPAQCGRWVPKHQRLGGNTPVGQWYAPLCIPDNMASSRPLVCLFLPKHSPRGQFGACEVIDAFDWTACFPRPESNQAPLRHCVLLDPLLPPHHRHTSTDCAGANWCSNPHLGGDPPGDHQSSHQERARTRGARAGRAEATHAAELYHERSWLNSWMCYQPVISFFFTLIMSESATSLMEHVTCLVSTGLTVTANHMSVLTIKYAMLHLLCYF